MSVKLCVCPTPVMTVYSGIELEELFWCGAVSACYFKDDILLSQLHTLRFLHGTRLQELSQWWDRCLCAMYFMWSVRSSIFSTVVKWKVSVGAAWGSFCWLLQLLHCSGTICCFCCCSRFALLQICPQTLPPPVLELLAWWLVMPELISQPFKWVVFQVLCDPPKMLW